VAKQLPDKGMLSLTNARLCFDGIAAITLPLTGLRFEPLTDGILVRRDSGGWIFRTAADAEVLHRTLARAIQDAESTEPVREPGS
jgi:hypothetical protein